jgi:hypothetical protein
MVDQDQFFTCLLGGSLLRKPWFPVWHQPLSPVRDVDFLGQNCCPVLDNVSRYRTSDLPVRAPTSNKSITIASAEDWKTSCYSFEWGRTHQWRRTSPVPHFPWTKQHPLEMWLGE